MSYRHTRAHNSLLVNGIGQPYSTEGYGSVMRAMGGQHISYCLGMLHMLTEVSAMTRCGLATSSRQVLSRHRKMDSVPPR